MKVFHNNQIVEKDSFADMFEPGFLFGWGVFETIRVYGKVVPFLELHIERLNKGIKLLGLEAVDFDFKAKIEELLKLNELDNAYIRITAYKKRKSTGIIIYADKFGYYGSSSYEKGFKAILSPYCRNARGVFSRIKSLSYVENRMGWFQAQKMDKDEALVSNLEGFLVGGARSNLFFVKGAKVITPSLSHGAFPGITKQIMFKVIRDLCLEVKEDVVTTEDLFSCDEAFLTSSLLGVMPLVEYEGRSLGKGVSGEVTRGILSRYKKMIREMSL
jgi:branched-chain amino acid aminotransferase